MRAPDIFRYLPGDAAGWTLAVIAILLGLTIVLLLFGEWFRTWWVTNLLRNRLEAKRRLRREGRREGADRQI